MKASRKRPFSRQIKVISIPGLKAAHISRFDKFMMSQSFFKVSSLILFSIILFASSCTSRSTSATEGIKEKKMVLEVIKSAQGPIYPPGKVLILRVFNNSEIEFEHYPQYGPDRVGLPFTSELKKDFITKEQLDTFSSLLDELNSQAKSSYSPTQQILDARVTETLNYESETGIKQIIMKENDSHVHYDKLNSSTLRNLMELVEQINHDRRKNLFEQEKR
jgi:hypothetical protein